MDNRETEQLLGNELFALATEYGGPIREAIEITRFINSGIPRKCFYIEFIGGQKIKGRICIDLETRKRLTRLLSYFTDLPLSPLIAFEGTCMLEKWIEGETLRLDRLADRDFVDAANILGAMHTISSHDVPLPSETEFVGTLLSSLEEYLHTLVKHNKLSDRESRVLDERATLNVPDRVTTGIIHNDFSYDNLVRDERSKLQLVDNNSMQTGALDFDIGKAFSRWPMSGGHRLLFLDTYSRHRSTDTFKQYETFWSVYCLVRTIIVHMRYRRDNVKALQHLKNTIQDKDEAVKWPEYDL